MNQYLLDIDAYDAAEPVGTSPAPTFTRATVAHKQDGSQVAAGAARYEKGKLGEAIMIEEGTVNLCLADTETSAASLWGSDASADTIAISTASCFSGSKCLSYLYGGTGISNLYILGSTRFTQTAATEFTMSIKIRYADGGVVTNLTGYLYVSNNTNVNGACTITPLRDGWYLCTYTRSGLTSGAVSLIGVSGLRNNIMVFTDDWQVEAKRYSTSFVIGTRNAETVTVPASVLNSGTGTIDAWVKLSALPSNMLFTVVDFANTGTNGGIVLIDTSNLLLKIQVGDGTTIKYAVSLQSIQKDRWHYIAVTWDASGIIAYLDGVPGVKVACAPAIIPSAVIHVGSNAGITRWFNGLIDDFRISNRVRSAEEIAATYSQGLRGVPAAWDDACNALYRFDAAKLRPLHYCTGSGYIDGETTYLPLVKQPGHVAISMFRPGATSGAAEIGYGNMVLNNEDGALDHLLSYGFDGRRITLKAVTSAGVATLFSRTMAQPLYSWNLLSLVLRDRMAELRVPLQPTKYLGNNALPAGLEGVDDIKGRPKPFLRGEVHNITPVLVNTSKLTYQVNHGAVASIPQVYDRGVAITPGANHATSALLQAATPAAGSYDTCLAEGYFRLGSNPTGAVTCNVIQGATAALRTTAQIAKQVVTRVIPEADVYAQGIIAVDAANSNVIGIYVVEETTVDIVLDEVCASIGCWYSFDSAGRWNLRQLTAPGNNPLLLLTEAEISTIDRLETNDQGAGVPAYKYTLEYDRNYTVQKDLAGSSSRLPYTSLEYRTATPAVDTTVQTKHILAVAMQGRSLLISAAAAAAESTRRLNLYKVDRDRLRIKCDLDDIRYPTTGWWDNLAISDMATARYGHASVVHGNHLYVIGGWLEWGTTRMSSVMRLDLTNPTGAWDDAGVTDLPAGRGWHQAVVYGNILYVIGGYDGTDKTSVIYLDLTNPSGAWVDFWGGSLPPLPSDREAHAAVVYGNWLYVIGGSGTASVIRIDLSNPAAVWDDAGVTDLPAARSGMSAAVYGNYLYVIGGLISANPSASVIRLDLTNPTGAWDDAGVTNLPAARHSAASVLIGSTVWLMGGTIAGGTVDRACLSLDLSTPTSNWDTAAMAQLPEGRAYAFAAIYSGSIYLIAGYTGTVPTANTYRYRSNDNVLDRAELVEIGQDVTVKVPRYNLHAGKVLKIIGSKINHETDEVTLDLWG